MNNSCPCDDYIGIIFFFLIGFGPLVHLLLLKLRKNLWDQEPTMVLYIPIISLIAGVIGIIDTICDIIKTKCLIHIGDNNHWLSQRCLVCKKRIIN